MNCTLYCSPSKSKSLSISISVPFVYSIQPPPAPFPYCNHHTVVCVNEFLLFCVLFLSLVHTKYKKLNIVLFSENFSNIQLT